MRQNLTRATAALALVTLGDGASPGAEGLANIQFHEAVVRGLHQDLPLSDPMKMFGRIFEQLNAEAVVYPTENYYYFTFNANGSTYSGNFRLSPDARANGRISFAYFDTTDPKSHEYLELGVDQGVLVMETGPLRYNVSYAGKTVTFLLNDISQQPPDGLPLLPSEHFVGRTFDESGLRFLLLYDDDADRFIWILDPGENLPLRPVPFFDELSFDMRTSFVFYRDGQLGRSVLAGVDFSNVMANNYFDGPFDQLPDNHIEETSFAEYVAKAYPGTKGLLNRRGESPDGASRLAITPYSQYRSVQEVASRLDICKSAAKEDRAILYSCMFHDYKSAAPLPEAR